MKIANDCVVAIQYQLSNDAGEEIDASGPGAPLVYLHGAGNIIPGLEDALTGKTAGEAIEVIVDPEAGYGPRLNELIQTLQPELFQGVDEVKPGMEFRAQGPHGETQRILVTGVSAAGIEVDANHPLAGETLHFAVTIESVRAATAEELEHGHVHDGHSHAH